MTSVIIMMRKTGIRLFYNDAYKLHVEFPLAESGGGLYKNAPFDVCESKLKKYLVFELGQH